MHPIRACFRPICACVRPICACVYTYTDVKVPTPKKKRPMQLCICGAYTVHTHYICMYLRMYVHTVCSVYVHPYIQYAVCMYVCTVYGQYTHTVRTFTQVLWQGWADNLHPQFQIEFGSGLQGPILSLQVHYILEVNYNHAAQMI